MWKPAWGDAHIAQVSNVSECPDGGVVLLADTEKELETGVLWATASSRSASVVFLNRNGENEV